MDDLVQWLGEQLDEGERIAWTAGENAWRRQEFPSDAVAVYDSNGDVAVYDEGWPSEGRAEHIVEHDPARALREIDAKRRALDHYQAIHRRVVVQGAEPYVLAEGAVAKQIQIMATAAARVPRGVAAVVACGRASVRGRRGVCAPCVHRPHCPLSHRALPAYVRCVGAGERQL
ncbi:DUF6221 family protein [Streptomyces sp. NBC_00063]|uniref:DUF6221 family protein n=1 Tax=Streptomyces sp. NBC_00063 TaxID=2975638 RepID=UPI0022534D7C|nr:DUF6221 family protein [Streptomyces sp. NBC_00063]MCX5435560.1 DUF6221 family protein [Streptomyces sp. NBC_00063]